MNVEFLWPDDLGYDESRALWNAMHDRRPVCVARCHSAAGVAAAMRFATAHGYRVTVRGGGHNVAGAAVADGAMMIDLSAMRGVFVEAQERVAHADGGCLLRDLDAATARYGLACPAGVVSHTGLGGLALGGGYGWLARTWGMTCDHILAAQVVLADGSIVESGGTEHPELMWALRGGGVNVGVVTRLTLRLRPVGPVYHHVAGYPAGHARRALAAYRSFAEQQPDTLHTVGSLARTPDGAALRLTSVYFGDPRDGPRQVAPLMALAPGAAATSRILSYPELQALGDHGEPAGMRYYTKSGYFTDLPDPAAAALLDGAARMPSTSASIDFEYLRGAIAEGPAGEDPSVRDGAFPNRDAPYIVTASAQWSDPAHDGENAGWARETVATLRAFRTPGVYLNYAQDSEWTPAHIYGRERMRRLNAVKQRYDPGDVLLGAHAVVAAGPATNALERI